MNKDDPKNEQDKIRGLENQIQKNHLIDDQSRCPFCQGRPSKDHDHLTPYACHASFYVVSNASSASVCFVSLFY